MTRRRRQDKRRIAVRCSLCDQLHYAEYAGLLNTAVGPVATYTNTCPLTMMASEYLADEEVQVP